MKKIFGLIAGMCCIMLFAGCRHASAVDLRALEDNIAGYVKDFTAETGVALIVNNADTLVVNNANAYPLMSVFKLHQAIALCHNFEKHGFSLDTMLKIERKDLDPQTWSPMLKDHTDDEFRLSVRELLRYTLMQSDNNASNLMFDRLESVEATDSFINTLLPAESFKIAYSEAQMAEDHSKAYSNSTSPLGAAILINKLYTENLIGKKNQEFLKKTLRECATGTDRIVAPLQGKLGVWAGHKTGSGYRNEKGELMAHNDVAYVSLPNGVNYSLAVFVKDFAGDENEAAKIIATVSEMIYNYLSK